MSDGNPQGHTSHRGQEREPEDRHETLPWERHEPAVERTASRMMVDLRRCTGCHACSVACKVEHGVPLGEFRMRVRWMEDPDDGTMAFLPVFDSESCDFGSARARFGMPPACVSACPTAALVFGDGADAESPTSRDSSSARPLAQPGTTRPGVLYIGHEAWQEAKLNFGAALHPDDEDILYEQAYRK